MKTSMTMSLAATLALALAGAAPAEAQIVPAHLEQSFVRDGIAYINQWEQNRLTFVEAEETNQIAGWWDAMGIINSIALADSGGTNPAHDYVYVVTLAGVECIEVTNPAAPVKLATYLPTAGRQTRWAKVVGGALYIAETGSGGFLRKYDVSNPAAPVLLAQRGFAGGVADVNMLALDASYLVLTVNGPNVIRTSDLATVAILPHPNCSGLVNAGRSVYAMCKLDITQPTRLHAYDLTNPAAPVYGGSAALSRVGYAPSLMSVMQQGSRRFVQTYGTDGSDEEDLITIEVTGAPVETSVLPIRFGTTHYMPLDLDVDGTKGYLYAAGPQGWNPRRWFTIVELNLANGASPQLQTLDIIPRLPD